MKKLFSAIIIAVLVCGLLTGYALAGGEEFNEEDADFTAKVIAQDANLAGMIFLGTPESDMFAEQIQNARDNGFAWPADFGEIDGSYTKFVSQMPNQLAAEGSGFEFNLNTTADNADAVRPGIGFNAMFYFTPDDGNLGTDTYNELLALCETLDEVEGGWVLPDSSALTDLGIHIYTMYNGEPQDITDRASFGINVAGKEDGKLLFSYGAVMVDREIADFASEGIPLNVSMEEELIWSDGASDGKIAAAWWIGKTIE